MDSKIDRHRHEHPGGAGERPTAAGAPRDARWAWTGTDPTTTAGSATDVKSPRFVLRDRRPGAQTLDARPAGSRPRSLHVCELACRRTPHRAGRASFCDCGLVVVSY